MFKFSSKKFHVSSHRMYHVGKQSWFKRLELFFRPYTKRAVYRTSGALFAL